MFPVFFYLSRLPWRNSLSLSEYQAGGRITASGSEQSLQPEQITTTNDKNWMALQSEQQTLDQQQRWGRKQLFLLHYNWTAAENVSLPSYDIGRIQPAPFKLLSINLRQCLSVDRSCQVIWDG